MLRNYLLYFYQVFFFQSVRTVLNEVKSELNTTYKRVIKKLKMKKIIQFGLIIFCQVLVTPLLFSQYVGLFSFSGVNDGHDPYGSLFRENSQLFGMTSIGGTNDLGTVFKINTDGSGFVKLMDFDGASTGSIPTGSLIIIGDFLYGYGKNGGLNDKGTIFRINKNGSGFQKLHDFNGTTDGSYPYSSLFFDGSFLYGLTTIGGGSNLGSFFKIMPDGTGFTNLFSFDGTATGSRPSSGLISDGTYFYGTTYEGGTSNLGTAFKILPDGTGYVKLIDFSGTSNGSKPISDLYLENDTLYGMTSLGGINDKGVIFKIATNGVGFDKMLDFNGTVNGNAPFGGLIKSGAYFYGATYQGGANNWGTLFKIKPNGSNYTKLLDFEGLTNGGYPFGSLLVDGTYLYGTTRHGGQNAMGTVYSYQYCTPPIVEATASDSVVCEGSSTQLNGVGATSYSWNNGVIDGVSFIPSVSTLYTVTGIDNLGCSNSASIFIEVDDCLETEQLENIDLEIYPNPTSNILNINIQTNESVSYKLVDVLGKTISQGAIVNGQIDVEGFETGIYYLVLSNKCIRVTKL